MKTQKRNNVGRRHEKRQNEGKKIRITTEEQAFYDAITKPKKIKRFYNDEVIKRIQELTKD